jgi:pSer/pThr/pTyr-binding forkhead associated (FHA) protein
VLSAPDTVFSPVNLELGVVCGSCDAYSPMGTARCATCNHDLALYREKTSMAPPPMAATPQRPPTPPNSQTQKTATLPAGKREISGPLRAMPASPPSTSIKKQAPENGPASVRRPQAPEVLGRPSPSIVPKVEVVGSPESWGHETTGKIPLRPPGSSGLSAKGKSKEELMEQAKNYVCRSCQTPIPSGHKFCGRCGAAVPPDVLSLREEYYGTLQVPGRAKLILIRAEGDAAMEGLSFALNASEHIVGRQGHLTFPEDRFVSPRHANLFYRDGKLVVKDEGSVNGVYVRLRGSIDLQPGDMFLAGEELFRVDATPKATDHPDQDGTYFWSSPKRPSPFRIVQVLQGGAVGNVVCARETGITIGREGGEMNYPTDVYMSATHCRVEADPAGKLSLTDLNSRNGTYIRMRGERELAHGDYIFIGKKILRVEVTS